jgi:hypothetical protein
VTHDKTIVLLPARNNNSQHGFTTTLLYVSFLTNDPIFTSAWDLYSLPPIFSVLGEERLRGRTCARILRGTLFTP